MDQGNKERPSPALLSAQKKLLSLREQFRVAPKEHDPDSRTHGRLGRCPNQISRPSAEFPKHFSWGSAPLTRAIRIAEANATKQSSSTKTTSLAWLKPPCPASSIDSIQKDQQSVADHTIKLYPDLALAMLKQRQVTTGRIWLILRTLDKTGSGWLDLEEVRTQLSGKASPYRVCGQRQLRKLMNRGEEVFWNRRNGRLWLRSPAKVAAILAVRRLTGRPVALPVTVLFQSIGSVRAHFYASFHSGRLPSSMTAKPKPVSRATMMKLGRISRRTQRRYENQAGVRCQRNFAISKHYSAEHHRDQAWQRGRAVFIFNDTRGKLGQPGHSYTAWQLPNSYIGPHESLSRGHQKRFNREIADLFMKGMTGNDDFSEPLLCPTVKTNHRCFFDNGIRAGASYNRLPSQDAFWHGLQSYSGDYRLWHLFPAQARNRSC